MAPKRTTFVEHHSWLKQLGPGLITGAADDDPSGIATYSQVGASFGYSILWTAFITFPLMVAIQIVSARIGRVSGDGLAANIRKHYPPWLLYSMVLLLLLANIINIAADTGAMGEALHLLVGGPSHWYGAAFGAGSLLLQVLVSFPKYAPILKGLTLALFAYVGTVFVVHVSWGEVMVATLLPSLSISPAYLTAVVAVFGTTISPYLFFWQASHEVEEQRDKQGELPLKYATDQAPRNLKRIQRDTLIGMAFSNLIAFFIMLTAAITLHQHGVTEIHTSAQAAEALRPVAGRFAFLLFAGGIVGCGLLAIPVLAGSAAYGVAEAFHWRIGLGKELFQARGFYTILALATLLGVGLTFTPVDPIKALFWSAVINGVIAVPIMFVVMRIAGRVEVMGRFVIKGPLRVLGWVSTSAMAVAVVFMTVSSF